MKFCLKEEIQYWWPVSVSTPHPSRPGSFETSTLEMQFRALNEDEIRDFAAKSAKLPPDEREKGQHDLMLSAILGWRGVVDESGQEIPFSTTSLHQAFRSAAFRAGVYAAYHRSISGQDA